MANGRKKVMVSFTIDPEVQERLKDYSEQSMVPISRLLEKAIIKYMDENKI